VDTKHLMDDREFFDVGLKCRCNQGESLKVKWGLERLKNGESKTTQKLVEQATN